MCVCVYSSFAISLPLRQKNDVSSTISLATSISVRTVNNISSRLPKAGKKNSSQHPLQAKVSVYKTSQLNRKNLLYATMAISISQVPSQKKHLFI